MEGKNHYEILGVKTNATPEEIKKAYVSLVKQYHPDRAGENEEKKDEYNEKLLEIMNSYEVLSNPESKAAYDEEINVARSEGVVSESESTRGKKMSGMARKTGDIETDYPISLALAAYGKGKIPMRVAGEHVAVKVYPGIRRYRVEGKGVPGEGGKKRGDLYVNLKVIPEEGWEIDEETNNLIHTMDIPAKIAENGGQVNLELLLKKTIKITIPPNTKTGDRFIPPECRCLGVMSPKKKGGIVIVANVTESKGLFGLFKKKA